MALRYGSKNGSALRYNSYSALALRYGSKIGWTSEGATPDSYFTFTLLDDDTYSIVIADGNNMPSDIVIPSTYKNKPVTVIGEYGFNPGIASGLTYNQILKNVYIPDSITTISEGAFAACLNLSSVIFGKNSQLLSIGKDTFRACISLTSIAIPNSVTLIGDGAFYNCNSLTNVNIPDGVTSSIGYEAFYNCSSLVSIVIPDSVTSIDRGAFYNCSSLASIVIPDSVTSIGYTAFYDCSSLTSIVIPNSVTSIDFQVFSGCNSLTIYCEVESQPEGWDSSWNSDNRPVIWNYPYVDNSYFTFTLLEDDTYSIEAKSISNMPSKVGIPASYNGKVVTSIGNNAFSWCSSLISVTIPNSITSIGSDAFQYCSNLADVTIRNNVTSIGERAFYNCSSLSNITIGDGVTSLGREAFYGTAYYDDENNWIDNVLYIGNYLIKAKNTISGEYAIKEGTLIIDNNAFNNCINLTSITIPNSVKSIGFAAFSGCDSLTSVTIGNSVTSIGNSAFDGCSNLVSVVIPNSVTSIGNIAFRSCTKLTSITIPDSVISIGNEAFAVCSNLTSIIIPDSVASIGYHAFFVCGNLTIYCEATEQPSGWDEGWNPDNCPVVWGYTG